MWYQKAFCSVTFINNQTLSPLQLTLQTYTAHKAKMYVSKKFNYGYILLSYRVKHQIQYLDIVLICIHLDPAILHGGSLGQTHVVNLFFRVCALTLRGKPSAFLPFFVSQFSVQHSHFSLQLRRRRFTQLYKSSLK